MKTKAFTLMEILISVSIIAILSAILYFALAPSMRLKGIQANIKSDLRQLSAALNLYMANNDDGFPAHDVPFFYDVTDRRNPKPKLPHRVPKSWCVPACPRWHPEYLLMVGVWMTRAEKHYGDRLRHPFDETKHTVFEARFHSRLLPGQVRVRGHDPNTQITKELVYDQNMLVLGSTIDGGVNWKPFISERDAEQSFYVSIGEWYR